MRVLSLFDWTGNMVRPWAERGHECTIVDIEPHGPNDSGARCVTADVATFEPDGRYDLVFSFPPCTDLAASGARWWAAKGPDALRRALALVEHAHRVVRAAEARVWMLENPVGRLATHWRKPDHAFDPCDFGGYLDPHGDAYTKRTCLWTSGSFVMPPRRRVDPIEGSKMHLVPESARRARIRSATPAGFALAVCLANGGGRLDDGAVTR